jgi:tRNA-binding protein
MILAMSSSVPVKPSVSIEALERLDIRVGTILSVEGIPGSRKLVQLTVDLGDHTRTVLSGMKGERENLQALIGVQTLFVINLEPRKMAGRTSEGMLLDIGYADGIPPALAIPERPIPNGSRAG